MTYAIVPQWPRGSGWTFRQHRDHGYNGGTDYAVNGGNTVGAIIGGRAVAVNDAYNSIVITRADGITFTLLESRSRVGAFPRDVSVGETIAISGLNRGGSVRFPHWHMTEDGVRKDYEPSVTPMTALRRVIKKDGGWLRTAPNTSTASRHEYLHNGYLVDIVGYVIGQAVGNSKIWFKTISGKYIHSSVTTAPGTVGLPDLTPPPEVTPEPEPNPAGPDLPVEAPDPVDPEPDPTPTEPPEPPQKPDGTKPLPDVTEDLNEPETPELGRPDPTAIVPASKGAFAIAIGLFVALVGGIIAAIVGGQ